MCGRTQRECHAEVEGVRLPVGWSAPPGIACACAGRIHHGCLAFTNAEGVHGWRGRVRVWLICFAVSHQVAANSSAFVTWRLLPSFSLCGPCVMSCCMMVTWTVSVGWPCCIQAITVLMPSGATRKCQVTDTTTVKHLRTELAEGLNR